MTDFEAIIGALSEAGVECVIVGGLAATIHGSTRLTQDVDFVYSRRRANVERLVSALRPHSPYLRGAPHGLPFAWNEATIERGLDFRLTTTMGDIDLLGEIVGGGTYEDLVPHTVNVEIFGHPCRCLDLPALIHAKRSAGRPEDLEVLAELGVLLEERDRSRSATAGRTRRGKPPSRSPRRASRREAALRPESATEPTSAPSTSRSPGCRRVFQA